MGQEQGSQHFVVRLWAEELEPGCREYRGEVLHPVTGARRAFRDWTTLERFLIELLERDSGTQTAGRQHRPDGHQSGRQHG